MTIGSEHMGAENDDFKKRLMTNMRQAQSFVESIRNRVIVDVLVPPASMVFTSGVRGDGPGLTLKGSEYAINRHALSQITGKVQMSMIYGRTLIGESWRQALFAHNLNELYSHIQVKEGTKYLHRFVGNELRGFLGRRFNRNLASAPLLEVFLDECSRQLTYPVDMAETRVRYAMTCVTPYEHKPIAGSDMSFYYGLQWSNSDFGAGKLTISLIVWKPWGGRWVLEDAMSKVHIGSILEDSDLELSDETANLELETQKSATRDIVRQQMSPANLTRLNAAIAQAHTSSMDWEQLRRVLAPYLAKKDIETAKTMFNDEVEFLPPVRSGSTSLLWAMDALSHFAKIKTDLEERAHLERVSGSLLESVLAKTAK